jgi:histidine ammonia-lyase
MSRPLRDALERVRAIAPPLSEDRPLSRDIEAVAAAVRNGAFDEWALPAPDAQELVTV